MYEASLNIWNFLTGDESYKNCVCGEVWIIFGSYTL